LRECKGMCSDFDRVSFRVGGKIYRDGVKYCSTCSTMIEINLYRCPCCSSNLRSKSHSKTWRDTQRGYAI
jgi:hypothetical protein